MTAAPPDPRPPADPGPTLRDRLALKAKQRPVRPPAARWAWWVFGGAVFVVGMGQVFGLWPSPVAQKVLEQKRSRGEVPPAPKPGGAPVRPATRDVLLIRPGDRPADVIKALREATGLGLADAKRLVDEAPCDVRTGVAPEEAERIRALLAAAGATVEVR